MNKPYVSIIISDGSDRVIDLTYDEFANLGNCYEHLSHVMRDNVKYGNVALIFADTVTQVAPARVRSSTPTLVTPHLKVEEKQNVCPHGKAITDERYPGLSGNCATCRGQILGNAV